MTAARGPAGRRTDCRIGAALLLAALSTATPAEDVHSNGTGGGRWSDATSWRGGRVPGPEDAAVIARGDTILFDRDDTGRVSIDQISIDPRAVLAFRPGGGRMVLTLGGAIECYGTIRLDATKAPATDHQEICFAAPKPELRAIRLQPGGAFVAHGRAGPADGRRNVVIAARSPPAAPGPAGDGAGTAVPAPAPANEIPVTLTAGPRNSVDVQRAHFHCVILAATGIDNTGAKADERLTLSDSLFTGLSQVSLAKCDSPLVAGNTFTFSATPHVPRSALTLSASPLADIRGNAFSGDYDRCIHGSGQSDSTVVNNTFRGGDVGVLWNGANLMLKGNVARGCRVGFHFMGTTGVVEDTIADGCGLLGFDVSAGAVQFINTAILNVPEKAAAMQVDTATGIPMLNCTVDPALIRVPKTGPPRDAAGVPRPWVFGQAYFVARVRGTPPAGTRVEVLTANPATPLPAGAMDMNIRNNLAPLTAANLTPLPQSLRCIVLATWSIGADGAVVPPPTYTVNLRGPAPATDAAEPVLKTVTAEPAAAWFRRDPNTPTPTLEIPYP